MAIHYTEEKGTRFLKLKYDGFHYIGIGETQTLAQVLGVRNKAVFECLALHQNNNRLSDLTQDQIAEMLGMSSNSVSRAIKEISEVSYEGNPIIVITQKSNGKKLQNVYEIQSNSLVSTFGESLTTNLGDSENPLPTNLGVNKTSLHANLGGYGHSLPPKLGDTKEQSITKEKRITKEVTTKEEGHSKMTNKGIIAVFKKLLDEKGIEEKVNYPRLLKQMKAVESLYSGLTEEEIEKLLKIIVDNYENWSSPQYPLCFAVLTRQWVIEKSLKILNGEKEEESQKKKAVVVAAKRQSKAIESIMSRIKQKGGQ